ncbi:MAG: hydroxyacid dehydrogenase [Methanopyri archaeon]|jgi:phosphoglycerate dehydrogenase-like enzyme|nr:hydroxyacid dehydrogenase [Methanopyri archaeon]MDP6776409.1 hydroxyacid dehydrogenase [Candidatus Latescibacterota bacterium]
MPKIYVSLPPNDPNLLPEDRKRLRTFADVVEHMSDQRPTDEEKLDACRDSDAAIMGRGGGGLTHEIIGAAEGLKVVGVVGGGVKMVEPEALLDRGILLINTGWAMSNAVAEFTVAMMLCGLRDIPHMVDVLKSEGWGRARDPRDLTGRSVGMIGLGMIARRVAELLRPYQNELRIYDPYVSDDEIIASGGHPNGLQDVLRHSKVLSLHAGWTPETEGMLGAEELALMPDGALLVNTARAAVVDEVALLAELRSGRLRAALNVFWKEPLAEDHPLRDLDNVILTPHGGGYTDDTLRRHSRSIVDDLERYFKGQMPENVVTHEMLGRMT